MRWTRTGLTLPLLVATVICVGGCAVPGYIFLGGLAGGGAVYTDYCENGAVMTQSITTFYNRDEANQVGDAVRVWLDRTQLPLPVLADGPHNFSERVARVVNVPDSRGARAVDLYDNGNLVAEYVVAWDRQPPQYRLVSATNLLYEGKLDVEDVPELQVQECRSDTSPVSPFVRTQ